VIDGVCPCCDEEIESMANPFGVGYCGCSNPKCLFCVWCCPSRNDTDVAKEGHRRHCPKVSGRVIRSTRKTR
jgi:hypothetical protein